MLIIGAFEHSIELEQALAVLEHSGIPRNHMLVVPMDTDSTPPIQSISRSNDFYYKAMEVGIACATASSVFGTSAGFVLAWGPFFWGLLAAILGFILGFGIYILTHQGTRRNLPKKLPEITVVVQCTEEQSFPVMETMWKYRVLTVGRAPEPSQNL